MDWLEEVLVPIVVVGGLWAMILGIVLVNVWGNVQGRREVNETVRRAIESGQALTPEVIASLQKPARSPEQDLRSGVILTALAIGLALAGGLDLVRVLGGEGGGGTARGLFIAAVIVGAIGVGQIAAWAIRRDRRA